MLFVVKCRNCKCQLQLHGKVKPGMKKALKCAGKCEGLTYYCSKKCQLADWKTHKPNCVAPLRGNFRMLNKLSKNMEKSVSQSLPYYLDSVKHEPHVKFLVLVTATHEPAFNRTSETLSVLPLTTVIEMLEGSAEPTGFQQFVAESSDLDMVTAVYYHMTTKLLAYLHYHIPLVHETRATAIQARLIKE